MNLSGIGDLSLRRRIVTMLHYLELKPGLEILDAGCGDGLYVRIIAKNFKPNLVVGIDNDECMVKNRQVLKMDIRCLRYSDNYFDRVLCTEVLEHVDDPLVALLELRRVLKPGGILAVTVPNSNYPFWWDPVSWCLEAVGIRPRSGIWNMHRRLYRPEEIEQLALSAGFIVEHTSLLTHYCIPFSMQILRAGALLHHRISIPGTDRHGPGPGRWNPLWWAERVFEFVDNFNEKIDMDHKSTVNIALKLRRPK